MRCTLLRHSPRIITMVILLTAGCGPMFLPMNVRLSDEDQKQVDALWNNMLTPINRVEHQTLLDVTISFWLYQYGVDRLHLVSEKYLLNGKVVMEIDCDRANPAADQFTITVMNDRGQTLRRERYTREEVEESAKILWDAPTSARGTATPANTSPIPERSETPDTRRRLERERRLQTMEAATQPAVIPIPK